jgi:TolA-binding protein
VPTYQIAASEGASWRTLERSERLRLAIMRGRFELSVDKLRSDQRFVLELPDGELEVVGTRFVVATDGERTLDVRVMEGRVALRLRAQPARELSAGQAWTSAPETAASSPATPLSTAVTKHEQPQVRSVRTQHEATRGHGPISPAAAYGHAAHPKPSPGHAFAAAVAAFSAGDYGRAETLLRAFERDHPEDARVEDALFLRAIAYARQGDENQRRELASEYLKRFPRGLRRLEAERLAR